MAKKKVSEKVEKARAELEAAKKDERFNPDQGMLDRERGRRKEARKEAEKRFLLAVNEFLGRGNTLYRDPTPKKKKNKPKVTKK